MNSNPYRTPVAETSAERPDDLPGYLRYREFRPTGFMRFSLSTKLVMRKLREEAEAFVNSHVGAENVVSITEQAGFDYTVTVWYRTREK